MDSDRPVCFCDVPCKVIKGKNGLTYYKCGVVLDYRAITNELKGCKSQEEKDQVLTHLTLGCKLFVKVGEYQCLHPQLFGQRGRHFPKCSGHNCICAVGVSHSERNPDRDFFKCSIQYPDLPCSYFMWVSSFFGEHEPSAEPQPPHTFVQFLKDQNRKEQTVPRPSNSTPFHAFNDPSRQRQPAGQSVTFGGLGPQTAEPRRKRRYRPNTTAAAATTTNSHNAWVVPESPLYDDVEDRQEL